MFFPKKSFNKGVNMTLLNNMNFAENMKINENDNAKIEQINQYIKKSMRFYNKSIDDLTRESSYNKFDNITFKAIRKDKKFGDHEIENFIKNFEKVEIDTKYLL
jgi:hypothetical protein